MLLAGLGVQGWQYEAVRQYLLAGELGNFASPCAGQ